MAKDYFRGKGMDFEDIDVGEDRAAAMEMIEKSGQMGVPVIDIDGEIVIGFDVPRIEEILDRKSRADESNKTGEVDLKDEKTIKEAEQPREEKMEIKDEWGKTNDRNVHEANDRKGYDVIIVGGSAAGLTAALFARRREMKTLVVTKDIGGQISETLNIENYPGLEKVKGPELAGAIEKQAKKFGAEVRIEEVVEVRASKGENSKETFFVKTKEGNEYAGRSLILAMGKTPRSLNVPGESKFLGKGVSYCATCDAPLFRDKTVAVVGGGNAAFDAALLLSKIATKVYLIHRRKEFRAFESVVKELKSQPNVEFVLDSVVTELKGDEFLSAVVVKNKVDGSVQELAADGLFIEIGSEVNTGFVKDFVELDELGQIRINKYTETSRPGVFAAGDVTDTQFKQIIVAAGEGCKAALAAYNYLHGIENKYVADWTAHKQN